MTNPQGRPAGYRPESTPRYLAKLETVKRYVREYWILHHSPPGVNDLSREFNASTSNVVAWLDRLESDGWIEPRTPGASHNIIPAEIFQDRKVFP